MSGKRAAGQKQVLILFRNEFLAEIDGRLNQIGFDDRSSFIRLAVYEKLQSLGYSIPRELMTAPDRAGKGGPKSGQSVKIKGSKNSVSQNSTQRATDKDKGKRKSRRSK